jgi:hypothetical protein
MDYTKIKVDQISVDSNNKIILPVEPTPTPTVSLDDMNSAMTSIDSDLALVNANLSASSKMLSYTQGLIDKENQKISELNDQKTALQALIDTATSQGALSVADFEASKTVEELPVETPLEVIP